MPDRSYFVWDVSPVLFSLGPFSVRWYGLLFALGFVLGYFFMRSVYRREGRPEADLDRLLLYLLAGTVVGARLGHVLFYDPAYYFSHPLEIPQVWKGGLASHGGALGILIAVYLYHRRTPDQPYLWLLDRIAVPTALAGAFIRLGNLFNSEILGVETDVPWAVVFARVDAVPRHPAQLYESLAYLLVFGLLRHTYRRFGNRTPRGLLLGLFFVLVFTARFFIEFVKVRQAAFGEALPLSMGQLLSLPAVAAGGVLLWHAYRHGRNAPPVTP
ncbi:prolipoprotein diacylglyceryl transferase [Rhodocaloribacter litoris]|uniref:prolipoprotein diacylglyceryl transferase n=1 Tax=Rhodocaloribacter litoris TaxID=2558931 RepID=UPI00141E6455|nr:prolipoprotein diacylglyceryl transferase [Rhodocaloribacter litoris]QXD15459.1 prolipoprotein diacylglyceryl transferase [Rhodocaloribacter litoris]